MLSFVSLSIFRPFGALFSELIIINNDNNKEACKAPIQASSRRCVHTLQIVCKCKKISLEISFKRL